MVAVLAFTAILFIFSSCGKEENNKANFSPAYSYIGDSSSYYVYIRDVEAVDDYLVVKVGLGNNEIFPASKDYSDFQFSLRYGDDTNLDYLSSPITMSLPISEGEGGLRQCVFLLSGNDLKLPVEDIKYLKALVYNPSIGPVFSCRFMVH